ncbi:MAG: 2-dehydropantoate 2-reductase [Chloroflexi bacterium]|nr:2-dehydropantoate 2-reductase [Chloroflexota bacterium]
MNVLTFGAGAIGTYIGGSLALTGNRVVFVEQPKAVEELLHRGLVLNLAADHRRQTTDDPSSAVYRPSSVEFVSDLDEALNRGPFDVAIFALKSFDTAAALDGMRPHADQLPPIFCLSNGVDNEPTLAAVLGVDKVIAGTVTSSVGRRAVGDIVLERLRGVGVADRHPLSLFVAEALNAAGLNAHLFLRAADMKWSKMLTNLPTNATAAILNMTAAEVFAHPGLFQLEMRMLRESLAVMRANRLRVVDLPRVPVRALALGTRLPEFVARPLMLKAVGGGRGGKMPSFHIDLHSGRGKSEVDWLNGAVVRYGEKAGVPTPVNKLLTETLLALTKGELPLETYSRQPEKFISLVSTLRVRTPGGR